MSRTDAHVAPGGSGRVLTLGIFVLAATAAIVLTLGTQDARLLRLGLIAALWAALLGAFAAARARREATSYADRSDQLRAGYQLELEREVAARREHARTVEREVREQAELSRHGEIVQLRAELATMRASLRQLLGTNPAGQRASRPNPDPHAPRGAARNGSTTAWRPAVTSATAPEAQRTVHDLLAAHGQRRDVTDRPR